MLPVLQHQLKYAIWHKSKVLAYNNVSLANSPGMQIGEALCLCVLGVKLQVNLHEGKFTWMVGTVP